jgi:hypothetical protein
VAAAVDAVYTALIRRLEAAVIQIDDNWADCEGDPREPLKDVIEVHLKDTDGSVVKVTRPGAVVNPAPKPRVLTTDDIRRLASREPS